MDRSYRRSAVTVFAWTVVVVQDTSPMACQPCIAYITFTKSLSFGNPTAELGFDVCIGYYVYKRTDQGIEGGYSAMI